MGWWKDVWIKEADTWVFDRLNDSQVPATKHSAVVEPDSCYISIFLRSMRIVIVRRAFTKFYGAVHSYISLPHLSGDKANFSVLTTPTILGNIDAANVDRVITLNRRLLGPIPYRGGDVQIEVGLFSIRSADLTGPYLKVLEKMSSVAGVSYLNMALPFVGPLMEGVNLLVGAQQDTTLEIGLSKTLNPPEPGYYLVMGAPRNRYRVDDIRVGDNYLVKDQTGQELADYPYMLICIEASNKREDFHQIPELSVAYQQLKKDVRSGDFDRVHDALAYFKRTTLMSDDLLFKDAITINEKVEEQVQSVLRLGLTSVGQDRPTIPDLAKLAIF